MLMITGNIIYFYKTSISILLWEVCALDTMMNNLCITYILKCMEYFRFLITQECVMMLIKEYSNTETLA